MGIMLFRSVNDFGKFYMAIMPCLFFRHYDWNLKVLSNCQVSLVLNILKLKFLLVLKLYIYNLHLISSSPYSPSNFIIKLLNFFTNAQILHQCACILIFDGILYSESYILLQWLYWKRRAWKKNFLWLLELTCPCEYLILFKFI